MSRASADRRYPVHSDGSWLSPTCTALPRSSWRSRRSYPRSLSRLSTLSISGIDASAADAARSAGCSNARELIPSYRTGSVIAMWGLRRDPGRPGPGYRPAPAPPPPAAFPVGPPGLPLRAGLEDGGIEAEQAHGVAAHDLARRVLVVDGGEQRVEHRGRLGERALGVRVVVAPQQAVGAGQRDVVDGDRVGLEGGVHLALQVLARE